MPGPLMIDDFELEVETIHVNKEIMRKIMAIGNKLAFTPGKVVEEAVSIAYRCLKEEGEL